MDCITDLDDNQSRLLEALQLSLPTDTPSNKKKHRDKKLSLNPIYRQVPRVVDSCCQHLERYGRHWTFGNMRGLSVCYYVLPVEVIQCSFNPNYCVEITTDYSCVKGITASLFSVTPTLGATVTAPSWVQRLLSPKKHVTLIVYLSSDNISPLIFLFFVRSSNGWHFPRGQF